MDQVNEIGQLAAALALAQGKFQPIKRNKTVKVFGKTKDGRPFEYNYAYAPLDEILNATRPALSENGLAVIQTTDEGEGGTLLKTMLIHASGQWVESYKNLGRFEDPQKFGGALTYYRRYQISAILGISSEEDDDANGVTGNETQAKQKAAARPAVDQSTGEVITKQPPKANGNGKAKAEQPTTGEQLLTLVNNHVLVTYNDPYHLRNAIRLELHNNKWDFPAPADEEGWKEAYKLAKRHADSKTTEAAPVAEAEKPF